MRPGLYRGRTDLQQDLVNINTNIAQISALFLAGVAPALLTADISDATSESAHPCWRQLEETAAQELRPNCPPAGPRSVVQRPGPPGGSDSAAQTGRLEGWSGT